MTISIDTFIFCARHAAPTSLRRVGLSRREANTLVVTRNHKLELGKRFKDFSDIEQDFRHAGIRLDRFDLADRVTERLIWELMLPKKAYEKDCLLLRFLTDPHGSIQDSYATI